MTSILALNTMRPWVHRLALLGMVVGVTHVMMPRLAVAAAPGSATTESGPSKRSGPSPGGLLRGFRPSPAPKYKRPYKSCLAPNEYAPADAIPIWKRSIDGVYMAVGTNRGFIGAALARTSKLLLVDRDPAVRRYNDILTGLLAISKDTSHHRELCLGAGGHAAWTHELDHSLPTGLHDVLRDPKSWAFWRDSVLHRTGGQIQSDFDAFHADPRGPGERAYQGANFAYYPEQLHKLRGMARLESIRSLQLELSHSGRVRRLVNALERRQETVSVLDLSNAWTYLTFALDKQVELLRQVRRIATPQSILLLTGMAAEDPREFNLWDLNYLGFTFAEIDRRGGANAFAEYLHSGKFRQIPQSLLNTLDGKPL